MENGTSNQIIKGVTTIDPNITLFPPKDGCVKTGFVELSRDELIYFSCINVLVSIVVILINCGTIYIMKKTKLLASQSIQLTLLLYIMDIGDATIGTLAGLLSLWLNRHLTCVLKFSLNFFLDFFINSTTYCITLISIDRYIHIKYSTEYSSIFTRKRFKMGIALGMLFTFLQTVGAGVMSYMFSMQTGKLLMKACGFVLMFANCLIYVRSRAILNAFERRGERLSANAKTITRIATIYLLLTIIFKLIPFLIPIMNLLALRGVVTRKSAVSANMHISGACNLYGIINSCIFLYVNRTAKKYLLERITCCRSGQNHQIGASVIRNNNANNHTDNTKNTTL